MKNVLSISATLAGGVWVWSLKGRTTGPDINASNGPPMVHISLY